MKYLGAITNDYDLVNKKYVDDNITDTKVTQTNSTSNVDYNILLGNGSTELTQTAGANKSTYFTFNPSTKSLQVSNGTTTGNIYLGLATSDDLYTAINNLGWVSSVIV